MAPSCIKGILRALNISSDPEVWTVEVEAATRAQNHKEKDKTDEKKEVLKSSAGLCNDHPNDVLNLRCSLHKSWVCEKCIQDQGDHPRDICFIISFKDEIEDRKQEYQKNLDDEGKLCDDSLSLIKTHMSNLREEKDSHISLVNKLQSLVSLHQNVEYTLQNELDSFQKILDKGANLKGNLLAVEPNVLNAATLDDSNITRDEVTKHAKETRSWGNFSDRKVDTGKQVIEKSACDAYATKAAIEHRENIGKKDKSNITQLNDGLYPHLESSSFNENVLFKKSGVSSSAPPAAIYNATRTNPLMHLGEEKDLTDALADYQFNVARRSSSDMEDNDPGASALNMNFSFG